MLSAADSLADDCNDDGTSLRVDGGPTANSYLMQFQSDILNMPVMVPGQEELSAIGAAYMAGIAFGLYDKRKVFDKQSYSRFMPRMCRSVRDRKLEGWHRAISMVLG